MRIVRTIAVPIIKDRLMTAVRIVRPHNTHAEKQNRKKQKKEVFHHKPLSLETKSQSHCARQSTLYKQYSIIGPAAQGIGDRG
jgi:hypothetical protein